MMDGWIVPIGGQKKKHLRWNLEVDELQRLKPTLDLIVIQEKTEATVCTGLLTLKTLKRSEVFFSSCRE